MPKSKKDATELETKMTQKLLKNVSTLLLRVDPLSVKIEEYLDIPVNKAKDKIKGKKNKNKASELIKQIEDDLDTWMFMAYDVSKKTMDNFLSKKELQENEDNVLKKIKKFFKKEIKKLVSFLKTKYNERAKRVSMMMKAEKERNSSNNIILKKLSKLNEKNGGIANSTARNIVMYGFNKNIADAIDGNVLINGVRYTAQLEMNTCIRCGVLDGTFYWKEPLV